MELWAILGKIGKALFTSERSNSRSRYRGVQLNFSWPGCCKAIRAVAGVRFLSHEIPRLPLAGCDAADCRCSYELFEDRRTRARRALEATPGIAHQFRAWEERNHDLRGRRRDDW